MRTTTRPLAALSLLAILAACGTTPPPPAQPAPEPEVSSAPVAPPVASSAAPSEAPPPTAPAAQPAKPKKPPREIITQPDVTFLLSFQSSAAGEAAETACTQESAGDPAKMGPCMTKAQNKLQVHAIRFVQDAQKNWWWHVMRRNGNQLLILHKVRVDFGEEAGDAIIIKPKGRDEGMAPWGLLPKDVRIEIVDEFTVAMQDPQDGRLVFEARLGAVQ